MDRDLWEVWERVGGRGGARDWQPEGGWGVNHMGAGVKVWGGVGE